MKIVRAGEVTTRPAGTARWTSQVWRADILRTEAGGLRSNRFVYAPGSRSNWHVHEGEQALIVISGRGVIAWEGLDVAELLAPGDWVHVSPGTPHWHGAVPDDTFEHLAVTATGGTQWYGPVDDASYGASMPVT
jgi:quercetin dioxygenase-like cupin family protein